MATQAVRSTRQNERANMHAVAPPQQICMQGSRAFRQATDIKLSGFVTVTRQGKARKQAGQLHGNRSIDMDRSKGWRQILALPPFDRSDLSVPAMTAHLTCREPHQSCQLRAQSPSRCWTCQFSSKFCTDKSPRMRACTCKICTRSHQNQVSRGQTTRKRYIQSA